MPTLFSGNRQQFYPLAERLRPRKLSEVHGQEHLTSEGGPLREILKSEGMISFLLWGPPGTGKTTIARIFANEKKAFFVPFSAVEQGVKDIREIAKQSEDRLNFQSERTILFIDEIHRLSKGQQDVLLPFLEKGTFFLIGATTENPSFSLNSALLSRIRVFLLRALTSANLEQILESGLQYLNKKIEQDARDFLLKFANGDGRILLNLLEAAGLQTAEETIGLEVLEKTAQQKTLRFDREGDEHYQTISAFIKSMRASDPDAAVYYLARLLSGGEDPRFIARRMVIFASEDVGLADHHALLLATAAYSAAEKIGMPEVQILLGHVTVYLAKAAKNNKAYLAINAAMAEVESSGNLPIPLHLRNASTKFLKELGFGKGYAYPHSDPEGAKKVPNLPKEIQDKKFFNE